MATTAAFLIFVAMTAVDQTVLMRDEERRLVEMKEEGRYQILGREWMENKRK